MKALCLSWGGIFHGLLRFVDPVADRLVGYAEQTGDLGLGQSLLHVAFNDVIAKRLNRIFVLVVGEG